MKTEYPRAIVGKTNVGKSTLLNALLHEDRAIVSDVHGTTRDIIEDTTTINGLLFRFIDTAGLRKTDDTIERIGIDRALSTINRAMVVLWVIDGMPTPEELNDIQNRCKDKHLIIVVNKTDIDKDASQATCSFIASSTPTTTIIKISAKKGNGIQQLEDAIYNSLSLAETTSADVVVSSARHYTILMKRSRPPVGSHRQTFCRHISRFAGRGPQACH